MVDGLFFCATFTGRRGGHTPFVQAGAETSDTGAEAVKPDPALFGRVIPGGLYRCLELSAESCGVVRPLRVPLMIRPLRNTYVVGVREADELLCGGYKWVSRFEAPCSCTRWTPWHGVLEIVWLHCDEAQQVGRLRGLEGCPLV